MVRLWFEFGSTSVRPQPPNAGRILNRPLTGPLKCERRATGIFHFFPLAFPRERDGSKRRLRLLKSRAGIGEVTEIAEPAGVRRASLPDAAGTRMHALPPLAEISALQWRALSQRTTEPNGYYLPDWELAVDASARDRIGASALAAWSEPVRLIGLLPVVSMWRAYNSPARSRQRRTVWHALHAAARSRSRQRRGCAPVAGGAASRRSRADPALRDA